MPRPTLPQHYDDSISLNKYIADTGFCSRRQADDYIAQARVFINNRTAKTGNRVRPGDVVTIDGEPIRKKVTAVYIACNKPKGITTTTDPRDKTNIIAYLGHPQRIFPIGRLDKDSEGLLFLTNDGNIVNKILRAGNNHEKEYVVTVDKPVTADFIGQMGNGVNIGDAVTLPCKVRQESRQVFRITLVQGLNRQIRRMCEALGYKVTKLVRVRIMNVTLAGIPSGQWRPLTAAELADITRMVANSAKTEEASAIKVKAEKPKPAGTAKPAAKAPKPETKAPNKATPKTNGYKDFKKGRKR